MFSIFNRNGNEMVSQDEVVALLQYVGIDLEKANQMKQTINAERESNVLTVQKDGEQIDKAEEVFKNTVAEAAKLRDDAVGNASLQIQKAESRLVELSDLRSTLNRIFGN